MNSSSCVCKSGFKANEYNRCEVLKCPLLEPPENGYFVKHPSGCGHVLNTACGARCQSGYQLIGSSIRLCQENGTWSGIEAKCVCKKIISPLEVDLTFFRFVFLVHSENMSKTQHSLLRNGNLQKHRFEFGLRLHGTQRHIHGLLRQRRASYYRTAANRH